MTVRLDGPGTTDGGSFHWPSRQENRPAAIETVRHIGIPHLALDAQR